MTQRLVFAALLCAACARLAQQTGPVDLGVLERTRDGLRERLAKARAADARIAEAPAADVLIGMPLGFTGRLVQEVTAGFLDQVEIALKDIKVHKEGEFKAKTRLGTVKPGRFKLDLTLHEARVLLKPGPPQVDFKGNRVGLALPVTLAQGQGRASVSFEWDSRGLGSAVCEDFQVKQPVAGQVAPRTYEVKGAFVLRAEDGTLVAQPEFPDLVVRLSVQPSQETWKGVERAIEERSWKCEKVLQKANVPKLLKGVLASGFDVRIPKKVFKTIRLPAGLQRSLTLEGKPFALGVKLLELRVTPDILWYGADVDARRANGAEK